MLKLKNRCIVILKDEEEKSSNYRVPKELFLKFQEELAQYRSERRVGFGASLGK